MAKPIRDRIRAAIAPDSRLTDVTDMLGLISRSPDDHGLSSDEIAASRTALMARLEAIREGIEAAAERRRERLIAEASADQPREVVLIELVAGLDAYRQRLNEITARMQAMEMA